MKKVRNPDFDNSWVDFFFFFFFLGEQNKTAV